MTPTQRSGLDRDEVVRVALQLLDEVGLDGLTMRSLAERLGVKAASLYWHLRDKDELAELMLEAINAEIPEPRPGLTWRQQLEEGAWAWRRILLKHRDAARLAMGRLVMRPQTLRRIEAVLATLRNAGFTPDDTVKAAFIFSNFVPGFVVEETTAGIPPSEPLGPAPTAARAGFPPPLAGEGRGGGAEPARLEIGWANRLILTADPSLDDLYLAYSDGPQPEIHAANRVVNLFHTRGRKPVTVVLNATVPWDIAARGGVSHVDGDLRGLQLRSLSVGGGASGVELTLGLPSGTVPIEVTGGISRLTIHRPAEAAVRVEGRGGVSRLTFDQRRFGGAGELTVQSPGFDRMTDRYAVRLTGGVSRIVIDMAMPPETPNIAAPSRSGEPVSLRNLPAAEYPNIAALGGQIMSPSMDELFRFGMTIILDGLELRLENRSAT